MVALARLEVAGFLLLLAGIIFTQLLTGRINTKGLFDGMRADGTRSFSAERVQLLVVTIWTAGDYLLRAMQDPSVMPDVDTTTLTVLGGSHALYLASKAYKML